MARLKSLAIFTLGDEKMKNRKNRKYEPFQFYVKWIVGDMMYFRAYKRDRAACDFQEYLIEEEKIPPENIRIIMV
jgi:hypothetical protein